MRIGIVGLGNIAQKAYLPLITAKEELELVLATRNKETLNNISKKYRIKETVQNLDSLIQSDIEAAFVHSSTESHPEIVEKLLKNNIHVYVDKPLAYTYGEAKNLVELSEKMGKLLMVGFNRRFAPMYRQLLEIHNPSMIIMEKNRTFNPGEIRDFIFDDFIHVIDTLRFLSPEFYRDIYIQGIKKKGQLHSVSIQLIFDSCTAIGIMNRDNGITEEIVEIMGDGKKIQVNNLAEIRHYEQGEEKLTHCNDWEPILYRRGFNDIINHFIDCVKGNATLALSARDSLVTHKICEDIVEKIKNI